MWLLGLIFGLIGSLIGIVFGLLGAIFWGGAGLLALALVVLVVVIVLAVLVSPWILLGLLVWVVYRALRRH
jgi:hypothetical protein